MAFALRLISGSLFIMTYATAFLSGCDREQRGGEAGHPLPDREKQEQDQAQQPLPLLAVVPPFTLTNQDGKPFGTETLKGKAYVAAFMFTRCPSICPELTRKMKDASELVAKKGLEVEFLSISVDPENDTPEVLKAYAKKHGADRPNWNFLTGDYQTILKTSEDGFKVGLSGSIDESKPHLGITHGSHLVLVDGQGQIRGYFRSSEDSVAEDLAAALAKLSM